MADEANESLPSPRSDGEPEGDDTGKLRRPATGMGSCCEDGKLEVDSVSLEDGGCEGFEARSDEVNGGDGDGSLEADLRDNDSREVNLGRDDSEKECRRVHRTDGEHDDFELKLATADGCMMEMGFEGCEAKQESKKVGDLIDGNGGVDTVNDSGVHEPETDCRGVMRFERTADIDVSNNDFAGCQAEACNSCCGITDNGPSVDSENDDGKSVNVLKEAGEEHQAVLGVKEENVRLWSEQPVKVGISQQEEFDHCQLQPAYTNGDFADQSLAVGVADNEDSVDSGRVLGDLIPGKNNDDKECPVYLRSEEPSETLGLAQKLEVEVLEQVIEGKHAKFPGLSTLRMLQSNCFQSSPYEKACVSKDINAGATYQASDVGDSDNVVSVDNAIGSGGSVGGRKEAEQERLGILGAEEEIGHIGSHEELTLDASKSVTEVKHDEFPGLSPLRMSAGGELACSEFGIGSEVGFLSSGVFDRERGRNGCEDAELLVSSELVADCTLVKINRDIFKTSDVHYCPVDYPHDCEGTCSVKRCKELHCLKAEKANFGQCNLNAFSSNEGIEEGKKFCLRTDQNLPMQYVGSQKEHCKDNIIGHFHKEISHGGYVDDSLQCAPENVASYAAAKGFALRKQPNFCTSPENFPRKLSSLPDLQGSEADSFIGRSSCRTNANSSHCEADNAGRKDSNHRPTIILRRSNPKRGASLRSNLADGTYDQLSRTRNNRRNNKKAVDVNSNFLLSIIKISAKLKRKRSCPCRPACPSVWGPVENLIDIFEKNAKLANYDNDKVHIQNKWSKEGRYIAGSKKQPKSQRNGNIHVSSTTDSATSDKPKSNVVICLPNSDCLTDCVNFTEVEAEHKLSGDGLAVAVRMLKGDMQLGDRDMDSSLTQEASVEMGECPGVSSQIAPDMLVETIRDMNSLDPGTSPDSDVYHPVIDLGTTASEGNSSADQAIETKDVGIGTMEGASLANHFGRIGQNVPVLESVSEDGIPSGVFTPSRACVVPSSVAALDPNMCAKAKKGITNGQLSEQPYLAEDLSITEKFCGPQSLNKTKKPSRCSKSKQKSQDVCNKKNRASSKTIKNTTRKGSEHKSFVLESSVPGTAELLSFEESMEGQNSLDEQVLAGEDVNNSHSESPLHAKAKGQRLPRGTKPGRSQVRSHCRETAGQMIQNACVQKGNSVQKPGNRCSMEKAGRQMADLDVEANDQISFSSGTVNPTVPLTQQNCSKDAPADTSGLLVTPVGDQLASNESKATLEQPLPPQVAWVLCEDCEKWRCISVELANTLEETKCKWTCKDNTDKAFADCSIPQEKTNAEINAELGISDEEDPLSASTITNGIEPLKLADVSTSQRAPYVPIKSNVFLHRNRKTQTIDEIMVCHCKPSLDGHRGCGDQCLNRMLNIECVKGTCPCRDLCSNQQFQKRKYAKFKWFPCGKKGYGLQLQQNVSQGQFLIEYVGEVLDLTTYEARQRYYASRGQKHFYFMTLNGGEVIDACAKGNLGRFINHSCEPNCRTEKWMVNGEVCIGLFAIRDIKKGEEVTFDYNYVRVVGAAAKKCVCGSSECRGYIGGDPLNSEVIVQGDSDEEDIEHVIIRENGLRELNLNDSMSNSNDGKVSKNKERSIERKEIIDTCPPATEVCLKNKNDICRTLQEVNPLDVSLQSIGFIQSENGIFRPVSGIQPLVDTKPSVNSVQAERNTCKPISDIQTQETSLQASTCTDEAPSDSVLSSKKSMPNFSEEKPTTSKPHSITKSSHRMGTIKRGRSGVKNSLSQKTKILTPGAGHSEGVEGKLNEVLDIDGGISKQKDATRGYLRLLVVTAAEGDRGCASQSSRDLSLILDAILKTKSRKVLVDIINKNGLQMLHNIMKQNRGDFNRIPIIRKLLKVLEFLALTGILTPELVNKDPPCSGMESFKESILKLASHSDRQVHKIAREFRDKWIPRSIRRIEPSDRDGGQLDRQLPYRCWNQSSKFKFQQGQAARDTDAIVITAEDHLLASPGQLETPVETSSHSQKVSISADATTSSFASGTQPRKRKSRWDHPFDVTSADPQSLWSPEDQIQEVGPKLMKCKEAPSEQTAQLDVKKQKHGAEREGSSWGEVACSQDLMQLDDERPPGFVDEGPPGFDEGPPGFGSLQKDCNSQFPSETDLVTDEVFTGHQQEIYLSQFPVSYGIPVALVQQLGTPETGGSQCNQNWAVAPGMPFHPFPPLPSYQRGQPNPREGRQRARPASGADATVPSTSGGMQTDMVESGSRSSRFEGRLRWPDNDCGRRVIRPERPDNRRFQRWLPRWPQERFGRGFRGNGRVGPNNMEHGNGRRDFAGGSWHSDGVNNYDGLSSNFQRQHH